MQKQNESIKVNVKLLYNDSKMPETVSLYNSGIDIFTHRIEDCGNYIKVYSGIAISPDTNHYFLLTSRSSIYKKGLIMHNGLGVIDTNYRGEIIGIFYKTEEYKEAIPGERLMQLVPQRLINCDFEVVDSLDDTDRGSGGFGSSGT